MTMGIGNICNVYGQTCVNLPDDDRGGLYRGSANWSPRMRGPQTVRGGLYFELWPASRLSPDIALILGTDWETVEAPDAYEPWSLGDGGKQAWYWIKGQVLDESSAAVGGAVVKAYRTSDDLFVSQTSSDSGGYYMCRTPYSGVSHYIVAYLDVATDKAGTTVNNLTPTAQ